MAALLTQQADAALAAANPQTPVGGVYLGPDGGLGGRFKYLSELGVFVNTYTGILVVIDWDLCLDFISTPYDVRALQATYFRYGETIRDAIVEKCGFSKDNHNDYWNKMHCVLHTLVKLRDEGHCDLVIVTRNSVENVEALITECAARHKSDFVFPAWSPLLFGIKDFPIISYPENNVDDALKKDKAQLLAECFPGIKSIDKVIFVDDSHGKPNREHERFAASAREVFAPETKIHHVRVRRCPRYSPVRINGRMMRSVERTPYGKQGLGNQLDKLDELATHILGTEEVPERTWLDACTDPLCAM